MKKRIIVNALVALLLAAAVSHVAWAYDHYCPAECYTHGADELPYCHAGCYAPWAS